MSEWMLIGWVGAGVIAAGALWLARPSQAPPQESPPESPVVDPAPVSRPDPPTADPPAAPGWLRQAPEPVVETPDLERLGPYRVEAVLGRGGMATVYRARDENSEQTVALKVAHRGGDLRDRFLREIEISQQLDHPNLVKVLFGGELEGQLCLVMEWLEGITLESILAGGPLPLEDFPLLACQVASGLHFAHKLQVLHRDIKPAGVHKMTILRRQETTFENHRP